MPELLLGCHESSPVRRNKLLLEFYQMPFNTCPEDLPWLFFLVFDFPSLLLNLHTFYVCQYITRRYALALCFSRHRLFSSPVSKVPTEGMCA